MRNLFVAAAALAALGATPAQAQSNVNFAGTWAVQTEVHPGWGIVSGAMVIRRSGRDYQIAFSSHSLGGERGTPEATRQTCVGRPQRAHLSIVCTVIETEVDGYMPDNFEVNLEGDTMRGQLVASNGNAAVLFTRVR